MNSCLVLAWNAARSALSRRPRLAPPRVLLDLPVANRDHAVRVGGDVGFVGDEDDGVAAGVQPLEQRP